jgi:hypothetical protein
MAIESRDTDESPAAVATAIAAAAGRGARMVVGPLSRSAVDALARGGGARLPVLALNAPSEAVALPPAMLAFGLRVEDEARFLVEALLRAPPAAGATTETAAFAVLVGGSPLGRRAGTAFAAAIRERGRRAETLELSLRQERLAEVGDRLAARPWRAILLALDAGEAAAVRPWLPPGSTVVATSRVYLGEDAAPALAQELEGVAFVDMPWLVEPDHPAVMTYPRAAAAYSAELDRLYALGIDAYRVAAEWLRGTARFEVDGVTGHLLVDAAAGRVERSPVLAVFAEGRVRRRDVLW